MIYGLDSMTQKGFSQNILSEYSAEVVGVTAAWGMGVNEGLKQVWDIVICRRMYQVCLKKESKSLI
jgi:hypothetical protein